MNRRTREREGPRRGRDQGEGGTREREGPLKGRTIEGKEGPGRGKDH